MRAAIDLTVEAQADLARIVDFLFDNSERLAWQFADAYEATLELLRDFPLIGVERDGYRRLRVGQTGYRLIYVILGDLVRIARIEHMKTPHPF